MSDALSAPAGETSLGGTDHGGILRPILALLLLASGHPSRLTTALRAVARACGDFGVRLVVIWPGAEANLRAIPDAAELEVVSVPPESELMERRRIAAAQVSADLMMFVEEQDVEQQVWSDVLASRVGFLRGTKPDEPGVDWRAALADLGVKPDADIR